MDGRRVCQKDCPNRTAECRLTCEAYKAYEAQKQEEYRKKPVTAMSYPDKVARLRNYKKNCRAKLTR